jgi:CRP-like cAMP-binding protein
MKNPEILDALRRSRLAAELTDAQMATLAAHLAFRELAPGEVLIAEGASDDHLYVVDRGSLAVMSHRGAEPETLFTLDTGDFVGELSFIDGTPHYAAVVASGPTRVFGLERRKLESLVDSDPQVVYRVMRAIVRTVHEIQRRLSMQSTQLSNYIYKQQGRY